MNYVVNFFLLYFCVAVEVANTLSKSKNVTYLPNQYGGKGGDGSNMLMKIDTK